jgi:hypothetical protein
MRVKVMRIGLILKCVKLGRRERSVQFVVRDSGPAGLACGLVDEDRPRMRLEDWGAKGIRYF